MFDVLIVGGGPAGLSAALVLARCCRRVLVCDTGRPRNAAAESMHGYLSRDGTPPAEFLRIAREQLAPYGVECRHEEVVDLGGAAGSFEATLAGGERVHARRVLLATGVVDLVPDLPGFAALYGRSVHHCPYCDGWEERDRRIAVYGRARAGYELALGLLSWSRDIALCTDGPSRLKSHDRARLDEHGITVQEAKVARLEGADGRLERIVFADGTALERDALFFTTGHRQTSALAAKLACKFTRGGAIWVGSGECSSVAGVYVAGDASRDAHLVIVAAAEGAKAAVAINQELQKADLAELRRAGAQPAADGHAEGPGRSTEPNASAPPARLGGEPEAPGGP
jgi:thioredoxin reductase